MKTFRFLSILLCFFVSFLLSTEINAYNATAKDSIYNSLRIKAEDAIKNGNNEEASNVYTSLSQYNDSIQFVMSNNKIKVLKDSLEIQQINNENVKLQSKLIQNIVVAVIVVLILLILLYFFTRRHIRQMRIKEEKLTSQIEELEHTTANKSLFLSNMSHEIRTPLNALSGFSDILCTTDVDAETGKQFADIIQLNSNLLVKLIDDVVDLSTLDLNNMKYKLEEKDAVALCSGVIESIQQIKQTDAEILFQTDLKELKLTTDSQRLQQVLINLIINATKFCKQGSIILKLEKKDGKAYFTVTDTGCGIPLEEQSKVFGRFEKLNEHADGTGLGLSICEIIIKFLGGEIGIDPEYTNGTRFFFTHPL